MHNVFNLLLASLCVADSMFLLCNIAIAPVAFGRMDLLTPGGDDDHDDADDDADDDAGDDADALMLLI